MRCAAAGTTIASGIHIRRVDPSHCCRLLVFFVRRKKTMQVRNILFKLMNVRILSPELWRHVTRTRRPLFRCLRTDFFYAKKCLQSVQRRLKKVKGKKTKKHTRRGAATIRLVGDVFGSILSCKEIVFFFLKKRFRCCCWG